MTEYKSFVELLKKGDFEKLLKNKDVCSVYKDALGSYFFGFDSAYSRKQHSTAPKWTLVTTSDAFIKMRQVHESKLREKLELRPLERFSFDYTYFAIVIAFYDRFNSEYFESVCRYFQRMLLCSIEIKTTDDTMIAIFDLRTTVAGFFINAITKPDLQEIENFAFEESIELVEGGDEKYLYSNHPFLREKMKWSDLRFIYHHGIVFYTKYPGYASNEPPKFSIRKYEDSAQKSNILHYACFSIKNLKEWKVLVRTKIQDTLNKYKERQESNKRRARIHDYGSKENGCPRCFEDPCMCSDNDLF